MDGRPGPERGKANHVTDGLGQQPSETSRFPHFLYSRIADGSEVVSLTRWPRFTPKSVPGIHSC
jgi:hypothetical protein